jgi:hypothetical protein
MELFRTEPPFLIKVYYDHFIVTWADSIESPDDKYPYKNIKSISIAEGEVEDEFTSSYFILRLLAMLFLPNAASGRRKKEYQDLIIEFRNGKKETRYINGPATPSIFKAVEMINERIIR